MRLRLSGRYVTTISGIGTADIAMGCSIFCLTLASATALKGPPQYSQELYTSSSLIVSFIAILTGIIAIESVKIKTTCILLFSIALSAINSVMSFALVGYQTYITSIWQQSDESTISNYTFASLIIGSIAASVSFLLGVVGICATCTEMEAYGEKKKKVQPMGSPSKTPPKKEQIYTVEAKNTSNDENNSFTEDMKPPTPLPLHEERPKTSQTQQRNKEGYYVSGQNDKPGAEDL